MEKQLGVSIFMVGRGILNDHIGMTYIISRDPKLIRNYLSPDKQLGLYLLNGLKSSQSIKYSSCPLPKRFFFLSLKRRILSRVIIYSNKYYTLTLKNQLCCNFWQKLLFVCVFLINHLLNENYTVWIRTSS